MTSDGLEPRLYKQAFWDAYQVKRSGRRLGGSRLVGYGCMEIAGLLRDAAAGNLHRGGNLGRTAGYTVLEAQILQEPKATAQGCAAGKPSSHVGQR